MLYYVASEHILYHIILNYINYVLKSQNFYVVLKVLNFIVSIVLIVLPTWLILKVLIAFSALSLSLPLPPDQAATLQGWNEGNLQVFEHAGNHQVHPEEKAWMMWGSVQQYSNYFVDDFLRFLLMDEGSNGLHHMDPYGMITCKCGSHVDLLRHFEHTVHPWQDSHDYWNDYWNDCQIIRAE